MKAIPPLRADPHGFSLVELLVVIAVIAIIAAIAIPNIANIVAQTNSAKDQRNAQTIASIASAAKAAGATNNLHLVASVAAELAGGIQVSGMSFGMSPLNPDEQARALEYLTDGADTNSAVVYLSVPVAAANPTPTP